MKTALYWLYGAALLGTVSFAEYRGWTFTGVNEIRNIPKSVRDNPGAYRSHYRHYPRYYGGK